MIDQMAKPTKDDEYMNYAFSGANAFRYSDELPGGNDEKDDRMESDEDQDFGEAAPSEESVSSHSSSE